jgi:hypothetical protein
MDLILFFVGKTNLGAEGVKRFDPPFLRKPANDVIGHETLSVPDNTINTFISGVIKGDQGMEVVWHDNITDDVMLILFQVVKPTVYGIITVCYFKKILPFNTSKCDKEYATVACDFSSYGP